MIYGLTSSYSGNFTVTLDNTTTSLSALSSYNNSGSLLFYATNLSQDTLHHIAVINEENCTLALQASGVNVISFGNSTTYVISLVSKRKETGADSYVMKGSHQFVQQRQYSPCRNYCRSRAGCCFVLGHCGHLLLRLLCTAEGSSKRRQSTHLPARGKRAI